MYNIFKRQIYALGCMMVILLRSNYVGKFQAKKYHIDRYKILEDKTCFTRSIVLCMTYVEDTCSEL